MHQKLTTAMAIALSISVSGYAQESQASDQDLCEVYGGLGSSVASFLLPHKLEDILAMALGKNPELAGQLAQSLTADLSSSVQETVNQMQPEEAALLSEHAGQTAFQLLLGAQADSPRSLRSKMIDVCISRGPRMIIGEMRASKTEPR